MLFFWQPCLLRCSWLQRLNQDLLSLMLCFRLYEQFVIYLNLVIARFIRPDYALKVNYKICSVLRYMDTCSSRHDSCEIFSNQISFKLNVVHVSFFYLISLRTKCIVNTTDQYYRSFPTAPVHNFWWFHFQQKEEKLWYSHVILLPIRLEK